MTLVTIKSASHYFHELHNLPLCTLTRANISTISDIIHINDGRVAAGGSISLRFWHS